MKGLAAAVGLLAAPIALITVLTATLLAAVTADTGGRVDAEAVDIPPNYLALYRRDGQQCRGLDWALLAAIGKVETDHGRSQLPGVTRGENTAGAAGPMQFLAATFTTVTARHPPPPGGARPPSRYNPSDSVHAAAAYLCDSGLNTLTRPHVTLPGTADRAGGPDPAGAPATYHAIWAYNHSDTYVRTVLARAAKYRAAANPAAPGAAVVPGGGVAGGGVAGGGVAGAGALAYARGQLGLPYLWGGDGPDSGDAGFDCSGLTHAAWAVVGTNLPRTAHTQYLAGPLLPARTRLQPGDLIFFGAPARVHHVGIATGDGWQMIHAPHRGATITITDARTLPDLLAASRPTAH